MKLKLSEPKSWSNLRCWGIIFVNIVEAPNNDAITKVSIELGSRRTVEITSLPATPIDEFISIIKNAKAEESKNFMHRV